MNDDPAIQAVRDARHEISALLDHDPKKLVEYYRRRKAENAHRVVERQAIKSKTQDENAA